MIRLDQGFFLFGEEGGDILEHAPEGFFKTDMVVLSHRIARDLEAALGGSRRKSPRVIGKNSEDKGSVARIPIGKGAPPRYRPFEILQGSLVAPGKPFHEKFPFGNGGRVDKNGPVRELTIHGRGKRFHDAGRPHVRPDGALCRRGMIRNPEPPT